MIEDQLELGETISVESEKDIVRLRVIDDGETEVVHVFPVEYALLLGLWIIEATAAAAEYREEH